MDNMMAPCPVCGSEYTSVVFSIRPHEAAQHFVSRDGNATRHDAVAQHIESLWGRKICEIRTCRNCEFGFADPYVAGDATFYNLAYERTGYPTEKWEFNRTLKDLRSTGFAARQVLDVGAGLGFFLDKIVDQIVPRSGIVALEYSDKALRILHDKGYAAQKTDIREIDMPAEFDAIFLFQVVEHMDDLSRLFRKLAQLLSPLGAVYLAVPNPARLEFNERHDSLLDMPPNHIGRWSQSAFDHVAADNNLKVAAFEIEPFSIWEFIKSDVAHSYLRQAQMSGTLANWSRALRSYPGGKVIGAIVAAAYAPTRIPVWIRAAINGGLGGSLWVKLVRNANYHG